MGRHRLVAAAALAALGSALTWGAATAAPADGRALRESVRVWALGTGFDAVHPAIVTLEQLAAGPVTDQYVPATEEVRRGLRLIASSSGAGPSSVVNGYPCHTARTRYEAGARRLALAARIARRRPETADRYRRLGATYLASGGRLEASCRRRVASRLARLVAAVPPPRGTFTVVGVALSRTAPLAVTAVPGATVSGPACPAPGDAALGLVVAYSGVTGRPGLQAAFGRFPGGRSPVVTRGLALAPGSGTVSVQVTPASGAVADGAHVAVLAANGAPLQTVPFVVDCVP